MAVSAKAGSLAVARRKLVAHFRSTPDKGFVWRFGIATVLVGATFALRMSLQPVLGGELPFTFFCTSAVLSAWLAGFGPGLYALATGMLLGDYFFLPPIGSLGQYSQVDIVHLTSLVLPTLIAIILIQALHTTRRRADRQAKTLATEVRHRIDAEQDLREAQEELRQHAAKLETQVAQRTAELENSVRFLERFCYTIAHDLRAPLRAMSGFAVALREDYGASLDETGLDYTERIRIASTRMDNLITELLTYGRLSHVSLQLQPVHWEDIVQRAMKQFSTEITAKKADIDIRVHGILVVADEQLLLQVLQQLLSNALKFIHRDMKPEIKIWTEETNYGSKLWIKDNGIGIRPEFQAEIFRMFERLDNRPSSATGVGLAIVSKAMERMKGRVGVISESGEGSSFWIELPVVKKALNKRNYALPAHL